MKTGLLAINKPSGIRSTWCVEKIRRILGRNTKVGHGGTLDSSASGLLLILAGGATRLSNLVMRMPKTYRARIILGAETTTCDATGDTISRGSWSHVSEANIESKLTAFLGWRMQVPPQISAVHVNGRRAHEMARGGENPLIEPRPVFIERIARVSPLSEDGGFDLSIRCGKGTYVRSIARDLGRMLGCGAHIAALCRERLGPLGLDDAYAPDENFTVARNELLTMIKPLDIMDQFLPCYLLPDNYMEKLAAGLSVPAEGAFRVSPGDACPPGIVMARSKDALSICRIARSDGRLLLIPETNIAFGAQ